jgi:hypothetical protein
MARKFPSAMTAPSIQSHETSRVTNAFTVIQAPARSKVPRMR